MHLSERKAEKKRNQDYYQDNDRSYNCWHQTQYLASFVLDDVPVLALDYLLSLRINPVSAEDVYKYHLLSDITWISLFTKKYIWPWSIVSFLGMKESQRPPTKNRQNFKNVLQLASKEMSTSFNCFIGVNEKLKAQQELIPPNHTLSCVFLCCW